MRCDNCPLCPTAEDDVCAIAESKEWGIEHKDGMMGCRHPRNWCEKKADGRTKGPKKRTKENNIAFENKFRQICERVKFERSLNEK